MRHIDVDKVPPMRWRNGGGATRELVAVPAGDDWRIRLSVADINHDGPFSAFPGVNRWFAVIDGPGVVLDLPGGARTLTPSDAPIRFDGADAPPCRLLGGPVRALNLMLRGVGGTMCRAGSSIDPAFTWPWRAVIELAPAVSAPVDGRPAVTPSLWIDLPGGPLAPGLRGPRCLWVGADDADAGAAERAGT